MMGIEAEGSQAAASVEEANPSLPESTAWTRTGESQQMVKPNPFFPRGIVI